MTSVPQRFGAEVGNSRPGAWRGGRAWGERTRTGCIRRRSRWRTSQGGVRRGWGRPRTRRRGRDGARRGDHRRRLTAPVRKSRRTCGRRRGRARRGGAGGSANERRRARGRGRDPRADRRARATRNARGRRRRRQRHATARSSLLRGERAGKWRTALDPPRPAGRSSGRAAWRPPSVRSRLARVCWPGGANARTPATPRARARVRAARHRRSLETRDGLGPPRDLPAPRRAGGHPRVRTGTHPDVHQRDTSRMGSSLDFCSEKNLPTKKVQLATRSLPSSRP